MIQTHPNPKTSKKTKPSTPCCGESVEPRGDCCDLVCFERPNYFCGHLLTDADLSLEQRYVVEKNKLHNRTLHGHGIVCGLRLTCDHDCPGGVLIDEGYAIDDCGNDLMVCEGSRFDIIRALRDKGWLLGEPEYDPCKPQEEPPDCEIRSCYYVAVCYDEQPGEYTTPFVAGCRPTLSECEPTRVREAVRFDVLDELPPSKNPLEEIRHRLEKCFCLFSEGPFADALNSKHEMMLKVIEGGAEFEEHGSVEGLYTQLRVLLLRFLAKYPDHYNCTIVEELQKASYPKLEQQDFEAYRGRARDAFCRILELAWQHVISCALGELIPRCPAPSRPSCVVLGTVEVERGRITHVCNCPRSYVWSFANFFEVLIATAYGNLACEEHAKKSTSDWYRRDAAGFVRGTAAEPDCGGEDGPHVCCREFELDCAWLLRLLRVNPWSLHYAGSSAIDGLTQLASSVKESFNFIKPGTYSPQILQNLSVSQAEAALEYLGVEHARIEHEGLVDAYVHPAEQFYRIGLSTADRPVVIEERQRIVVGAFADQRPEPFSAEERSQLDVRMRTALASAEAAIDRVKALEHELAGKREEVTSLKGEVEAVTSRAERISADVEARMSEMRARVEISESRAAETRRAIEDRMREAEEASKTELADVGKRIEEIARAREGGQGEKKTPPDTTTKRLGTKKRPQR